MTTTNRDNPQDKVLEAYFELGAQLPVEYGTPQYDRLRDIAVEVGSALVRADSGETDILRKEVLALAVVSSVVDHFPVLVNRPDLVDNPDVDRAIVELIDAGVTELEPFLDETDPTKFDESDDEVTLMLTGLKGALDNARLYNLEATGSENPEVDDTFNEEDNIDQIADETSIEDETEVSLDDTDEIEGITF